MVARVDSHSTSRSGDNIKVCIDMEAVHFFDKETEMSIMDRVIS